MDWTDLFYILDLHDAGCLKWLNPIALIIAGIGWYYVSKMPATRALSALDVIWLILVLWRNNEAN
ncbi:MAG TPA: hypothetical protein PKA27_11110 [Fimbriimonadaceae bacterium]|nr:hypothetical protein [Fimbriimonadaceae bacterium]